MPIDARTRTTEIVAGIQDPESGTDASASQLFPLIYDELRRLARGYMAGERPGHTLQPTGLVNEAYLKLVDLTRIDWQGRTHFLAVAATAMRRLLIDHARGRGRQRRGGEWRPVTLGYSLVPERGGLDVDQLLDLDAALEKLALLDARQAKVVELRFFAGLSVAQVATALGLSKRTVEGDWQHARAWLRRELS